MPCRKFIIKVMDYSFSMPGTRVGQNFPKH